MKKKNSSSKNSWCRRIVPLLLFINVFSINAQTGWPNIDGNPDIPIVDISNNIQAENSVFISPIDKNVILNSNNSAYWNGSKRLNDLGVSNFSCSDGGTTWTDNIYGTYQSIADPSVAIGNNGWLYLSYVNTSSSTFGIGGAYYDGTAWTQTTIAAKPGGSSYINDFLDKSHLWIDNSSASPYEGNLYCGWIQISPGSDPSNDGQIVIKRSTDHGQTWDYPTSGVLSSGVISHGADDVSNPTGTFHKGVNIQTGPNGEVYACWAITDNYTGSQSENAIGFAQSTDGGVTWSQATRIATINGTKGKSVLGGMGINSFPSMTVNKQTGEIFIVWTEFVDLGSSFHATEIYMIRSGDNWVSKTKVNQDPSFGGQNGDVPVDHWFPWIACDEISGALVVIYYDARNFADLNLAQTFVSISYDQGINWTDYELSAFNEVWEAKPIPGYGVNSTYAGDYIGIDVYHGKAMPVWSDARLSIPNSRMLAYTHPFDVPCTDNLLLRNIVIAGSSALPGEAFYTVYDFITAAGVNSSYLIAATGSVTMQAGDEIRLEEGFYAQGEFHAEIVSSCTSFSRSHTHGANNQQTNSNAETNKLNTYDFSIFPNPNNGSFRLTLSNNTERPANISVEDLLGNTLLNINNINSYFYDIDLSNISTGMFIVKANYPGKTVAKRIIKN